MPLIALKAAVSFPVTSESSLYAYWDFVVAPIVQALSSPLGLQLTVEEGQMLPGLGGWDKVCGSMGTINWPPQGGQRLWSRLQARYSQRCIARRGTPQQCEVGSCPGYRNNTGFTPVLSGYHSRVSGHCMHLL